MIWNTPCPKCRRPVLVGASECSNCHYHLMRHEISRAVWRFGIKTFVGVVVIAAGIFALSRS